MLYGEEFPDYHRSSGSGSVRTCRLYRSGELRGPCATGDLVFFDSVPALRV